MSIQSMYTSATSLEAQTTSIDNSANNLANLNTTAFKSSRVSFQDLLYQTTQAAGGLGANGVEKPVGIQVGKGVSVAAVSKEFSQGTLQLTGRELDIGIDGEGFLRVQTASGDIRYTRDGALQVTAEGQLITSGGQPIEPAITIPPDALSVGIGPDGTVSVEPAAAPGTTVVVGQIEVTRFVNPQGLFFDGGNLYAETAASGTATTGSPGTDGLGTIRQGFLEDSNVEVVTELIELLTAQRAFEAAARVVETGSEMIRTANEMLE